MPWGVEDVDKHMKDLTDAQKETWMKVANAALHKCTMDGGQDCEASAIKQANAAMSMNMSFDAWSKQYALGQTYNLNGVEIFSAGRWNGDDYTESDIDHIVSAFAHTGWEPPLKLGHNSEQEKTLMQDGQPALGWVRRVYKQGGKLLADFAELPSKLYDAMKRGNYKRVSSEIYWNVEVYGKTIPRVLKAVARLGADIPAVTNLEAIAGLYKDGQNDYKVYTNKEDKDMAEIKELETKVAELTAQNVAAETKAKELEAEKSALETAKTEAETKLNTQAVALKATQVKAYISEQKKAGRVLPAFEKELEALLIGASDQKAYSYSHEGKTVDLSQRETIERMIGALPKLVEFKELGGAGDADLDKKDYTNAGVEVDRRAKVYLKKGVNGVKVYEEAVKAVLADDAELKKDYLGRD